MYWNTISFVVCLTQIGTDDATERLVQANDNGAKKSIPKKGFVYIIKMVGTANFKPPEFIKVGKTNNLVKRRSDLNAGNPFRLAYVAAWKVTDMKEGEKQAHKYLNTGKLSVKPYLDGGSEWFALPTSTQGRSGLDKVHDEIQELLKINSLLDRKKDGSIVASKESLEKY